MPTGLARLTPTDCTCSYNGVVFNNSVTTSITSRPVYDQTLGGLVATDGASDGGSDR